MGPAQASLDAASTRLAGLRAELDEQCGARDYSGAAHTRHDIARLAEEIDDLLGPASVEQEEDRRARWGAVAADAEAGYRHLAGELLDHIAGAEAAVLAVAESAAALSELVERHRRDGHRPEPLTPWGGQLLRATGGDPMPAVDPAAAVLAVAAVGLAAGNAARLWPQALDQAQAVRSTLVLPSRSNTKEETS